MRHVASTDQKALSRATNRRIAESNEEYDNKATAARQRQVVAELEAE